MPTGYTATLYDGEQDFETFAMECARAFGALVTLRDEPNALIPDKFEPSDYNRQQAEIAEGMIADIEAWTPEQADEKAREMHKAQMTVWRRDEDERNERKARYEAMLVQVEAWEPPTPEHVEMKKFMADQLRQSIDFDCRGYDQLKPERHTGSIYKEKRLAEERRRLERAREAMREEEERARKRTEWVRALRRSLGLRGARVNACALNQPEPSRAASETAPLGRREPNP